MATEPHRRLTIQEYLAIERQALTKSDYLDGEMLAMSGASRKHGLISLNLAAALHGQLLDSPCELFAADMRVRTVSDLFTYPDVVAACGEPRFDDAQLDTLLNPTLVVEVLSKSTEAYDRTTKLAHYQTIPSLTEVVFVSQHQVRIERWWRDADGWHREELADLGDTLPLTSVGCRVPLAAIYRRVTFTRTGE